MEHIKLYAGTTRRKCINVLSKHPDIENYLEGMNDILHKLVERPTSGYIGATLCRPVLIKVGQHYAALQATYIFVKGYKSDKILLLTIGQTILSPVSTLRGYLVYKISKKLIVSSSSLKPRSGVNIYIYGYYKESVCPLVGRAPLYCT